MPRKKDASASDDLSAEPKHRNAGAAAGFDVGCALQRLSFEEEWMKFRSLITILGPAVFVVGCAQPDPRMTTSVKTTGSPEPGSAPTSGRVADTPATAPFGGAVTDAGITASVKTRLLADRNVSGMRIEVDTRDRIVTLTGIVHTAAEKSRALDDAAKVDDVARVEDRLMVPRR
jgi:hypothetical protein